MNTRKYYIASAEVTEHRYGEMVDTTYYLDESLWLTDSRNRAAEFDSIAAAETALKGKTAQEAIMRRDGCGDPNIIEVVVTEKVVVNAVA